MTRDTKAGPQADEEVLLADNRKATFDYLIERRVEAGIALLGTEIKSIRAGRANLREGYARVERGEVWLDRKSTRLNSSHVSESRMPSSA